MVVKALQASIGRYRRHTEDPSGLILLFVICLSFLPLIFFLLSVFVFLCKVLSDKLV